MQQKNRFNSRTKLALAAWEDNKKQLPVKSLAPATASLASVAQLARSEQAAPQLQDVCGINAIARSYAWKNPSLFVVAQGYFL